MAINSTDAANASAFDLQNGSMVSQENGDAASRHLAHEALSVWSLDSSEKKSSDSYRLAAGKAQRPDIESGLFDPNAPISHFDTVAPGVYRSGRPNLAEDGVKAAVEKVWGDSGFDPAHAKRTTMIELRGHERGKYYQPNEDNVRAEDLAAQELGITHRRFPMQTHEIASPEFIQSVLAYIDQRRDSGDRVLFHCFHGTDRTGTIAAAYELTHEPLLESMLRNNPDEAFQRALKGMTDNGFVPEKMPELTQSLKDFVAFENKQLNADGNSALASSAGSEHLELTPLFRTAA